MGPGELQSKLPRKVEPEQGRAHGCEEEGATSSGRHRERSKGSGLELGLAVTQK